MDTVIKKKVFNTGEPKHRKTITLPDPMNKALLLLSKMQNESVPWVVLDALEYYLNHLAETKAIPWPKKS